MTMPRLRPLLFTVAVATAATGCFWTTTKSEGKRLRRDVTALEARVTTKEEEHTGKVAELQKTLDEAAKVLKRNSADLGAEVERVSSESRTTLGVATEAQTNSEEVRQSFENYRVSMEERIAALEARIAELEKSKTAPKESADDLWTAGKAAFEAGKFADARTSFKKLVLSFPQHERADDAQYFRGETHFSEKDWEGAIREYTKVFDNYADSSLADDALFRAGEAAENTKSCTEARTYFGLLKQKYPKSSLAKKAAEKDKALKAAAKDKKKCES
jgi:tol-pal system protein YbgF